MTAEVDAPDAAAQASLRHALKLCSALIGGAAAADAAPRQEPPEDPAGPATVAPPQELLALQAALMRASQALQEARSPMPAAVLGTCAAAASRLGEVPLALARQAAVAIERALQEVLQPPGDVQAGSLEWALELFAAYSAVAHLAGAQRVHPAELWPAPSLAALRQAQVLGAQWAGQGSAREPTPSLLAEFEEALLVLMRQPGPASQARMTELCAGLALGRAFAGSAVWPLAAAVYEAQRDERLKTDVQLKRLGSRLLSVLRAAAGYGSTISAPQIAELEQELSFACARAWASPVSGPVAPGPWLRSVAQALGLEPLSVPDRSSLSQRVAGLPSMADLDHSNWDVAPPAEDSVRRIGPLRLDIEALNRFLNEADERSRRLQMHLSEWVLETMEGVVKPPPQAGLDAQWMAQSAAQIGHEGLARFSAVLAEAIAALQRQPQADPVPRGAQARLLEAAVRELDRVLHQFAAGFLKPPSASLQESLNGLCATSLPQAPRASEASEVSEALEALEDPEAPLAAQAPKAEHSAAGDEARDGAINDAGSAAKASARDAVQALDTLAALWRLAREHGLASADEASLAAIDAAFQAALLRCEALRDALEPPPHTL